jgi:hypothetical protein
VPVRAEPEGQPQHVLGHAAVGRLECEEHARHGPYDRGVSPTWIWMQIAVVVFVVIGMVIAAIKLWG